MARRVMRLTVPKEVMPALSFMMTCGGGVSVTMTTEHDDAMPKAVIVNDEQERAIGLTNFMATLLEPFPAKSIATMPPSGWPNA